MAKGRINPRHPPTSAAMKSRTSYRRLLLAFWMFCGVGPAYSYPDRPLTLVVPFPATGSADIYGTPRITKLVKMMQTLSTPSLTDSLALELVQSLSGALD